MASCWRGKDARTSSEHCGFPLLKSARAACSRPSVSLPSGAVASSTAVPAAPEQVQIPRLDVATAKMALQGFAPFGRDPEKQERYLSFLRSQLEASSEQARRLAVPAHMTAEQFSNELRDFAKSAAVFRPMSSAIRESIHTASAAVMAHETKATTATPGLRHPAPAAAAEPSAEDRAEECEEEELSVAQKAARMGNFGHLTRSVEAWLRHGFCVSGLACPSLQLRARDAATKNRAHQQSS